MSTFTASMGPMSLVRLRQFSNSFHSFSFSFLALGGWGRGKVALGFELRASPLLGKHSYSLSHPANHFTNFFTQYSPSFSFLGTKLVVNSVFN
jgi:hypothetical protein